MILVPFTQGKVLCRVQAPSGGAGDSAQWGQHAVDPFDWAVRFERQVCELLLAGNNGPLIAYETLGYDAMLSAPAPDHYLPLL